MTKELHLPIDPLVPYIRHRERIAGGRVELARKHHRQLGISEAGAARMFDCRHKTITFKTADRICLVLGLHINLVYGREVYEQGLDEDDVTEGGPGRSWASPHGEGRVVTDVDRERGAADGVGDSSDEMEEVVEEPVTVAS